MLSSEKKGLMGSPSRDKFKKAHKEKLPDHCWALDADLMWVEKHPSPFIVALLDFKNANNPTDRVEFTEVIAYNDFVSRGIPVYVAEGDVEPDDIREHRFDVSEYHISNPKPKPVRPRLTTVGESWTWHQLGQWELDKRRERQSELDGVIERRKSSIEERGRQTTFGPESQTGITEFVGGAE